MADDDRGSATVVEAIALVDYDNVRLHRREDTEAAHEENLEDIVARLATYAKSEIRPREIALRLYDGWVSATNQLTQRANRVLKSLGAARVRREGITFRAEMVFAPALAPTRRLVGTFRHQAGTPVQKMVDSMLCLDAIYFSEISATMIASDDDDIFVGALAASARRSSAIHLLRARPIGEGLNDNLASDHALVIRPIFPKKP